MTTELFEAIRAAWGPDTAAGELWDPDNQARGQCDVTSLVVFDYLGGDLQLAKVLVGGEQTEHHYWNLLPDGPLDLSLEQFGPEHTIEPLQVVSAEFLRANYAAMQPDVQTRHARLRARVEVELGHSPTQPLAASV